MPSPPSFAFPLPAVDAKEPQNHLDADIKGTEGNATTRSINREKSGGFFSFSGNVFIINLQT